MKRKTSGKLVSIMLMALPFMAIALGHIEVTYHAIQRNPITSPWGIALCGAIALGGAKLFQELFLPKLTRFRIFEKDNK